MVSKQFVYAVTRRDFTHHTDQEGSLNLIEIYTGLDAANAAAKSHLVSESFKAKDSDQSAQESENKDGGYEGSYQTSQDERDNFPVEVKKMELKNEAPAASKSATTTNPKPKANIKKRNKPEPEPVDGDGDQDDAEDEPPVKKTVPKKAAKASVKPSAKQGVPEGKKGSLKGLKILFTGTFESMDRKTSEQTAETYGATMAKKLVDADWIILGTRAGQKKLDEIEEKGLPTMDEAQFLEMLKSGKPPL